MRLAEEVRTTKETNIQCKVNLDGSGQAAIATAEYPDLLLAS